MQTVLVVHSRSQKSQLRKTRCNCFCFQNTFCIIVNNNIRILFQCQFLLNFHESQTTIPLASSILLKKFIFSGLFAIKNTNFSYSTISLLIHCKQMLTHKDKMQKSPMKCVCKIKKIPNSDMEFGIFMVLFLKNLHFH